MIEYIAPMHNPKDNKTFTSSRQSWGLRLGRDCQESAEDILNYRIGYKCAYFIWFCCLDDKSMTLSKERKLNTIINSNLFLLEGSNKWTPKKWGLNPPRWGVPLKETDKPVPTHYTESVRVKINFNFKEKEKEEGEYLQFKLWAPQLRTKGPAGLLASNDHNQEA